MAGDDLDDDDVTPGGSRIIKGAEAPEAWTPPESYAENVELVEDHLTPVLGEAKTVLHELMSDLIHLDVLVYPPNDDRDFWVYVTSGMSDLRMTVPADMDAAECSRVELMIGLPREWGDQINRSYNADLAKDENTLFWPVEMMRALARYPHLAKTWFGPGHTIPNHEEEPYAENSRMNGALFIESTLLPEERLTLALPDGDSLHFLGVLFLYPEEMSFKLKKGFDALADKLDQLGVTEVLDIARPAVVQKKRFLRLLGFG